MSYAILMKQGFTEVVEFPESGDHLDFYYETVECSTIDIVPAYGLEGIGMEGYDLVVDDEGLLTGKPINILASLMYGSTTHGQPLIGDVLLCKRTVTPDGMDSTGMTHDEVRQVFDGLNALIAEHNKKVRGGDDGED